MNTPQVPPQAAPASASNETVIRAKATLTMHVHRNDGTVETIRVPAEVSYHGPSPH